MEIADKDNNGELDYKEFHEFISKMDGIMMSEDEIRCMFNEFDGSGNEQLSVGYGHWKAWVSCASDWGTRSVEPCAGERRRDN